MNDVMAHLLLVASLWFLMSVSGSSHALAVGKQGAESAGQLRFSRKYDAMRSVQEDEWKPLDYGHPMRDDPTVIYVPPVVDPVHYGIDSAEPLWPIRAASAPKADYDFEVEERRIKPRPSTPYKSHFNPSDQRRSGTQIDYLLFHSPAGKSHLPRKPVVPHPLLLQAPVLARNRFPPRIQAYRKTDEYPAPQQPVRWNNWLHPPAKTSPITWAPRQSNSWAQTAVHPPPFRSPVIDWTTAARIHNPPPAVIDRKDTGFEQDHRPISLVVNRAQPVDLQGRRRNGESTSTAPPAIAEPVVRATTPATVESTRAPIAEAKAVDAVDENCLARARSRFASFVIQQGHSKVKMYGNASEKDR